MNMIRKSKIISNFIILIYLFTVYSCNNKRAVHPENKRKDTIEYMTNIDLTRDDMHGEHYNILADNDSIFYSYGNDLMYKNGKILKDTSSEDIIKKYHLKKINYKIFLQDNYKESFTYEDCITSTNIKLNYGHVAVLHSKKGSICQYIDVKGRPYIFQICTKNKKYKINLGSTGDGHTHAQLYDIDKDGKEELILTEEHRNDEYCSLENIMYCYKINYIDF